MGRLKVRLILAFLSLILLPIGVTGSLLQLQSSELEEKERSYRDSMNELESTIKRELTQTSVSDLELNALVNQYAAEINIKDAEGETVFTSYKDPEAAPHNEAIVDSSTLFHVQAEDGRILFVELSSQLPFTDTILRSILISVGSGLIALILLIIGWTWYISRTILSPLKEIYAATEEVKEGNLDYPIQYRRKDEIGKFIRGFNTMRTHLKQSQEKEEQFKEDRKQLIANISHDLRTPLSSIKGYVEGLQDGVAQTDEMQEKYFRVIRQKTDQLDHLIEDLFQFSKLDLRQLPLDQQFVDSRVFFQSLLDDAVEDGKSKNVCIDVPRQIPSVTLSLDPVRITQVMNNLTENAVRYGADSIVISTRIDHDESNFTISVKDNGEGMEKEELTKIFSRFYRAEKSRSRESGGTGLGLAIVKSIIEQHGGSLWADSELNYGSTITFTLPFLKKELV
ncbi:two-component sensor histidine kinase [Halobacillus halophilus]|uniref:histidine kinase n=1 Tax=Halobacillus halophilus (strain ATCC 35676 / DSM 2266 / JCM 20832 / KCTC 3685 / LMG 17431 / NBRC 102448 / NCIMB 2269) TaxID=866895 RepID=I0JJA8_HALH3|nr:ATP-binding protein [Halobacillus halophilus]ASF38386.1 two-component sensor histidine kinase [Halobacillus halophilus]CCG44226.1 two-component sensor histidine kinase [Halobacillus halophilus DSM 2266]